MEAIARISEKYSPIALGKKEEVKLTLYIILERMEL